LDGHDSCVRDVAWHPFYPCIISSSWDATISRWDYSSNGDDNESEADNSDEEDESVLRKRKRKNPRRSCRV